MRPQGPQGECWRISRRENVLAKVVPEEGVEPSMVFPPTDFKSVASAISPLRRVSNIMPVRADDVKPPIFQNRSIPRCARNGPIWYNLCIHTGTSWAPQQKSDL